MTRNRPPSRPTPTFMCAADNANKILWLYEVELVDPGHLLRAAQSERESTEWREKRDAKEDRRSKYGGDDAAVVEAIMWQEEVTWTEATIEADRIAPLYCGQPYARIAATMFVNHFGYDDPGERARGSGGGRRQRLGGQRSAGSSGRSGHRWRSVCRGRGVDEAECSSASVTNNAASRPPVVSGTSAALSQ